MKTAQQLAEKAARSVGAVPEAGYAAYDAALRAVEDYRVQRPITVEDVLISEGIEYRHAGTGYLRIFEQVIES